MNRSDVTASLAKLIDSSTRPAGDGYIAERHPSMPDLILVWAPCDCCWVASAQESFVSTCNGKECMFSFPEATYALDRLREAEAANGRDEEDSLAVLEAQASDMISEGGPG